MVYDLAGLAQNVQLLDELYEQYRRDPASVDPGVRQLFETGEIGVPGNGATASVVRPAAQLIATGEDTHTHGLAIGSHSVWPLVLAYRLHGHQIANLDPLGMLQRPRIPELDPETHGFTGADRERVFPAEGLPWAADRPLGEVLHRLRETYSGSIGLEFQHISSPKKKEWLAQQMEDTYGRIPDRDTRLAMLEQVIRAETFESFCHTKFPGTKRFSLEGSEGLMPLLESVLDHAARLGTIETVIGMAHRGRLNVLTGLMGRLPRFVFSEFQDIDPESTLGGGDVKYHIGYSHDRIDRTGRSMHLSLAFNPSHLEAVDPVIVGRVRAKQRRHGDWEHERVLGILVHGDAAFAGQGLVAETLQLSNLHGYRTGGTVHVIVNNQIGFTASPREYRSTPYCTDVAKMIQCPIWHVNGDDLDAVARVVEMAMEYRSRFHSDVVIDMFCYRKFGHNEMDEPSFTQPLMYRQIQRKESVDVLYGRKLLGEGLVDDAAIQAIRTRIKGELEEELTAGKAAATRPKVSAMAGIWSSYVGGPESEADDLDTGVPRERLMQVAEAMTAVPDGFDVHPKVKQLLERRALMGKGEELLDWGMGELFAYGTLLWDGIGVRLSGQDSSRGTFSHRHAVLTDVTSGAEHISLGSLHPEQGHVRIYDSPLSEAGVMGFEFGYSLDCPDSLVLWEAQFGDFANGAQVIIDQFLVASEDKWNRLSGLVLLLPHGYEGQGPEHSSARVERFLQLCAEDNIQVVQPTTPAQVFHLLRRQVIRPWRKPLVVLTGKSLLRLPGARSSLDDLTRGRFQRVIGDPEIYADGVRRVILCSGRVYYDLVRARAQRQAEDTAIIRVEQLYPWQPATMQAAVAPFRNAGEFIWVQDEPENMGPWGFLRPRLEELFGHAHVKVVSREASASPATGSGKAHAIEQAQLLRAVFGSGVEAE